MNGYESRDLNTYYPIRMLKTEILTNIYRDIVPFCCILLQEK